MRSCMMLILPFITLHMPGEDLVACHQSRSFEESVDEAIDAIKRQLDKFKGKLEK